MAESLWRLLVNMTSRSSLRFQGKFRGVIFEGHKVSNSIFNRRIVSSKFFFIFKLTKLALKAPQHLACFTAPSPTFEYILSNACGWKII